jgi:hypothetical protein
MPSRASFFRVHGRAAAGRDVLETHLRLYNDGVLAQLLLTFIAGGESVVSPSLIERLPQRVRLFGAELRNSELPCAASGIKSGHYVARDPASMGYLPYLHCKSEMTTRWKPASDRGNSVGHGAINLR